MEKYLKFVFFFFLVAAFLFEGLGIKNGRVLSYGLILLLPVFLFIPEIFSKSHEKILFPLKFSILYFLFILFSLFSSIFSVNLQNSFEQLFLYIALFLVFIFVYNYKHLISETLLKIIFVLALIFSLFSIFISFFALKNSFLTIPLDVTTNYYQFVYSAWAHNHLSDFLLLPLIILIFRFLSQKFKPENLLFFLFFIPYFIFAYSRSAYLDLALVISLILVYYLFKKGQGWGKHILLILGSSLAVLGLIVLVFSASAGGQQNVFGSLNFALREKFDLGQKQFFAGRNVYLSQGLFSFVNNPILGLGPGNFEYASQKYSNSPTEITSTGHNIFLDILVENGFLAEIFFILLFFQIFSSIKRAVFNNLNKNESSQSWQKSIISNQQSLIYPLLFIAMLLNFQTDFTYQIYSFFLLFFAILGLVYEEKSKLNPGILPLIISIVLLFFISLKIISSVEVSKQDYTLAFYAYPLNREVYQPLISRELYMGNKEKAFYYLSFYTKVFKGDYDSLIWVGDIYDNYEGPKYALPYYEKAFLVNKFIDPLYVKKIYDIKSKFEGRENAKELITPYFKNLSNVNDPTGQYQQTYYQYRLSALKVCREIYNGNCPYSL